jgi:hypothetical protein
MLSVSHITPMPTAAAKATMKTTTKAPRTARSSCERLGRFNLSSKNPIIAPIAAIGCLTWRNTNAASPT